MIQSKHLNGDEKGGGNYRWIRWGRRPPPPRDVAILQERVRILLPSLFFTCPLLCHPSKFSENILRFPHVFLFSQANKLVKYLLVKDQTKIPIKRSGRVIPILLLELSSLLPSPPCHGANHLPLWPPHPLICPPLPSSHLPWLASQFNTV